MKEWMNEWIDKWINKETKHKWIIKLLKIPTTKENKKQ